MLYIKFVIFCVKVMFNLKHFKDFLEYDDAKGKNHRVELRTVDRKIKAAARRGMPKKEHVFLSMFYEAMDEEESEQKKSEMITLFSMLFLWYSSLETKRIDE